MIRDKPRKKIALKGWSRFPKRRCYGFLAFLRGQPCILAGHPQHQCGGIGERWRVEVAHIKTRGAAGDDLYNALPCCPALAEESEGKMGHRLTAEKYQVDWEALAKVATEDYLGRQG